MTDIDKQTPIDRFKDEVDASKQHEVDTKMADLRGEADRHKRRYDDLLNAYNTFRGQCGWLDALSIDYTPPKVIKAKSKTGTGEGTAIALASDWHVYETVKPEQVNGLNSYNPDIAKLSVTEFFNGILAWTEIHRTRLNIKTLVLALLGDFITNMLFEDAKEDNAGPVQEEVLFALRLICGGIDMLLENGGFDKIIIPCCAGNHARDIKEVHRASGKSLHTYEWLMYKFMSEFIYQDDSRVEFQIVDGYHNFLNIYGKIVRFHHGDWVRYMGGIGGLTIPMNKAIKAWNVGSPVDFDAFAHWHQTMNPGLFISNGSVIGYNPCAVKIKAEYERPQQSLLIADSERFITSINRIYVR